MPIWVEWGDAIWQIAFVVGVVMGAAWRWSSPRRHATREAKSWIVEPTSVERFEEGANTIVEGTLEGGHDSAFTGVVGYVDNELGDPLIVVVAELQSAQRVVAVCIEAGGDQDELRLVAFEGG